MTKAHEQSPGRADDNGVHRLRDIVVEEVSLVDRAANKRRFLVVKRSDDMGIEADETRDSETTDGDVEKAKKKPASAPNEGVDKAKRKKPDDEDDIEDAEKAARSSQDEPADEEDEDQEDAENASASDEESSDEDSDESDKKKRKKSATSLSKTAKEALLGALTDGLERLMAIAKQVKDAPDTGAAAGVPASIATELSAVTGQLSKLVEAPSSKAKSVEVAKGARMAKERLDRFQKALALLADILKELTDSKELPAGPTAGAAEAGVKKSEAGQPPVAVPGLAELVKSIGELTKVVKRQEEELGRIRQTRGVSNAIPVEGSGRRSEPEEISWPLDMNRPISRDKVKKETSFFDD